MTRWGETDEAGGNDVRRMLVWAGMAVLYRNSCAGRNDCAGRGSRSGWARITVWLDRDADTNDLERAVIPAQTGIQAV
ncbi:hypothetical protein EAO82_18005 [Halopseudomonas pelagia]|uniref:Uncharacterized protein n=1 Tax=Halopseudomonas pelagia TaxID=553151 RepID=A0AA91U504_9GAMM|nr:hypothetical protein CO192_03130 [Halopseudomonas pelagia]QFY58096.1 hypothetical protein EAO82_18005 [Halopseudomonas pelagia]